MAAQGQPFTGFAAGGTMGLEEPRRNKRRCQLWHRRFF